jgi:hypothetical protein
MPLARDENEVSRHEREIAFGELVNLIYLNINDSRGYRSLTATQGT